MSSDMNIVAGERHQEVDQRQDDLDTGGGGDEEHDLRSLNIVNAELLDLWTLHQHVHSLRSLGEEEVEWIKVYGSLIPLNLLCAANT